MAVVVDVVVPSGATGPDTTTRRIFEDVPGVELEVESIVPIGDGAIPYFWAWGEPIDDLESTLDAYPEVGDVTCIERVDGGALFSVEWDIDDPVVACLARANGAIMEAYGTAEEWSLTIWFERGDDASAFQQCCHERGLSFDINRLRSVADVQAARSAGITPAQREALVVAYDMGFFERPRRTTQAELAEELEVSSAAIGNRIRRGTANLVEELLIHADGRSRRHLADDGS